MYERHLHPDGGGRQLMTWPEAFAVGMPCLAMAAMIWALAWTMKR